MAGYKLSLDELKKRLSELIAERRDEEERLAGLQAFIENLPPESAEEMVRMGSSSRSRRNAQGDDTMAMSRAELIAQTQSEINKRMESIKLLWFKIHELQEQERRQQQ
jgi:hypothetical protein